MPLSDLATLTQIRTEHRTERYKSRGLIVRRGFSIPLQTSSKTITFTLVPAHPQNNTNLAYRFTVSISAPRNGWTLMPAGEGSLTLYVPSNAIVGMYSVSDGHETIPMALLFNPFHHRDEVYMQLEEDRNEYVLNDLGRIWVGSNTSPSSVPWIFAQFRTIVLLASLSFLDSMSVKDRNNPVKVTRHLSAVLNSQDDNGVLMGRWDGNYDDGTPPSAWTGSISILTQYWQSLKPVKYGQCWVFAALFTSVMRSLGLPCRCITNYLSAHDTTEPYNRAVDKFYDSNGKLLQDLSSDSIWNFHVWNEAFMKRPDLLPLSNEHQLDYSGWQILDATPQEQSSALYQLGPAPLTAVKHGYTVPMDVDFVIGEVNADVIHYWKVEGRDDFRARRNDSQYVGQNISTKALGRDDRSDVTLSYKFREGTPEERASLAGTTTRSRGLQPRLDSVEIVTFEVESPDDVQVGEAIVMRIRGLNNGTEPVSIIFNCLYRATDYTGAVKARIGEKSNRVKVEHGFSEDLVVKVPADMYELHLGIGVQTIQFNSSAKVVETGQVWSFESLVRLNADDALHIRAPTRVGVGEAQPATAIVTNISHMPLTNVRLHAEGEGLANPMTMALGDIASGVTVEAKILFEPSETGSRLLIATLDSAEMKDISRSVHIEVGDKSGRMFQGQSVWHGKQVVHMTDLVLLHSRQTGSVRNSCCLLC